MDSESYAGIWQSSKGPMKVYQNLYISCSITVVIEECGQVSLGLKREAEKEQFLHHAWLY